MTPLLWAWLHETEMSADVSRFQVKPASESVYGRFFRGNALKCRRESEYPGLQKCNKVHNPAPRKISIKWEESRDPGCVQIQGLRRSEAVQILKLCRWCFINVSSFIPWFEGGVWWILYSPPYPKMHCWPTGAFCFVCSGWQSKKKGIQF